MHRQMIFGTPIWRLSYPNFQEHKQQFVSCVQNIRKNDPIGVKISNTTGYQSKSDLVSPEKYPELNPLFDFIGESTVNNLIKEEGFIDCDVMIVNAWANINDSRSCINLVHTHAGVYSGVFYLKAPKGSGELIIHNDSNYRNWEGNMFRDPKLNGSVLALHITPKEGEVVIWHSCISHYVLPNQHDDERISIAFNITCIDKRRS